MRAEQGEAGRQDQGPERRRRAGDGNAGVVDEATPLGEIPREVQVNPRVVEGERGEPRCPGDLPLPEPEEAERERQGGRHPRGVEESLAPARPRRRARQIATGYEPAEGKSA